MKFEDLPPEKQIQAREEALEINALVDAWLAEGKETSADRAAEKIIDERAIEHASKETFGNWAEMIARDVLARHPMVEHVEEAPRVTNDTEETDMFIQFKNGPRIASQFTVMGFEGGTGKMRKTLEQKALSVMRRRSVSYHGEEDVPLSMIKGNPGEFSAAIAEWESEGRKGTPADYMRKDFADKAINTMIQFLEAKSRFSNNPKDARAAQQIERLHEQFEEQRVREKMKKAG